jgi:hypothetical protein
LRVSGLKSDIGSLLKVDGFDAASVFVLAIDGAIREQIESDGLTIYQRFRVVKATTRESCVFGEGGVCKVVLAIDTEFHVKRLSFAGAFAPMVY